MDSLSTSVGTHPSARCGRYDFELGDCCDPDRHLGLKPRGRRKGATCVAPIQSRLGYTIGSAMWLASSSTKEIVSAILPDESWMNRFQPDVGSIQNWCKQWALRLR